MGGAIRGTAPQATLVVQSLLNSAGGLGGIPADLHDLFTPPYTNDKARVHTNSWGATQPGLPYDASANEIDDTVWNHQDLVVCFAAGNDGIDANSNGGVDLKSVGSQSAAKNCITVGASESLRPRIKAQFVTYSDVRPSSFPANPLKSDPMANDAAGMAAFSCRGPTQEGRIKPDVVAPGTSILSTHSRVAAPAQPLFGTSSDPMFFFDTATSMATPLTAGCAAVLRETPCTQPNPESERGADQGAPHQRSRRARRAVQPLRGRSSRRASSTPRRSGWRLTTAEVVGAKLAEHPVAMWTPVQLCANQSPPVTATGPSSGLAGWKLRSCTYEQNGVRVGLGPVASQES